MTTPTGQISASDIISEMNLAPGTAFSMNNYRGFAGLAPGLAISMSDYKNKFRTTATNLTPSGGGEAPAGLVAHAVTSYTTASTPTGGAGPFTYFWTKTSGDGQIAGSSTAANTNFEDNGTVPGWSIGYFTCTITNTSTGAVGYREITATFYFNDDGSTPP